MSRSRLLVVLLMMVLGGTLAYARTPSYPHPPTGLEIPFLERDALGARWASMGGASIAAVDDGSSMFNNPAGLGKIRRIEVLGSVEKQSRDVEATWFGRTSNGSVSSTGLRELTVAFPFPTYRGSLVMAGSVHRRNMLRNYTYRTRLHPVDTTSIYDDAEETRESLTAWAFGVSAQVSPKAYVGIEAHAFSGQYKSDIYWDLFRDADSTKWENMDYSRDSDLRGYGASVGAQFEAAKFITLGLVLRTPQVVRLEGVARYLVERSNQWETVLFDTDKTLTLPYSAGLGIALAPANFLCTVDLLYTDWQEVDYESLLVRDPDTRAYLYGATTDVRAGIEYSLAKIPLRLRAGYSYVPLELNWFDVTKQRKSVTLGAGGVFESSLALDVAWEHSSFERESEENSYSEKRTTDRIILTFAYRF